MKSFRHSFCDPFKPEIIELGDVGSQEIIKRFEQLPWDDIISKMAKVDDSEIYFSPSLEFTDKITKHGLSISGVGTTSLEEFYVFYQRPKQVKKLFGLLRYTDSEFTTDVTGQTKEDAIEALQALIDGNYEFLDSKIK
ncbi:hypothetical protein [Pontibacter akesuensis]|uniref:Uncharacterized protein n=1 Tax=Pontibacter akesuensis TaxID=388950 RepID=A0A1I7IC24_9BACT|nr:hypothetical protein [Pontibacter akesuensis]GHA66332.1 hypothetical protein GCM10007389_19230 [Pontibacter akesuensis]SFU70533.1 hypothetical protein SAMN04487941_2089 [Pontibacter akesuensis]